ncbi:MAG: hypothetical protein M1829_005900 [Trizodia sp. TS-e1964]|nr:MAG: hypothetical protein M1829_005900 [Trizodia sp. TS-e1964]
MMGLKFDGYVITPLVQSMIEDFYVGSIILSSRNLRDAAQISKLTYQLQSIAKSAGHTQPLLIGIDQENGMISPFGDGARGTQFPGAMAMGATQSPSQAYDIAKASAKELKAVGINWNLAPVLDTLDTSGSGKFNELLLKPRSFGNDPQLVGKFGVACIQGLRDGGIPSCAKHFPGTQAIEVWEGSQEQATNYKKLLGRLEDSQLVPFRRAVAHLGLDSVMLAPLAVLSGGEGDSLLISRYVVQEMLRRQIGYRGMVVTNCSFPREITESVNYQSPLTAIQAGSDLVILGEDSQAARRRAQGLLGALKSGLLSVESINGSAERISVLKKYYLSWDDALIENPSTILSSLISENQPLCRKSYEASVTMVRSSEATLSKFKNLGPNDIVLLLTPIVRPIHAIHRAIDPFEPLGRALARRHGRVRHVPYAPVEGITSLHNTFLKMANAVIMVTCNSSQSDPEHGQSQTQSALAVQSICGASTPIIAIAACDPLDLLAEVYAFPTYICTYEYTSLALECAVEIIFGEKPPLGILPIILADSGHELQQKSWKVDLWEQRRDAFASVELWKSALGEKWPMDVSTLSELLDRPGCAKHFIVRQPSSKKLLGLCATFTTPIDEQGSKHVGSLALLVVIPDHRNMGIGLSLHTVAMRELSSKPGITAIQVGSIFPRIFAGIPVDTPSNEVDWFSHRGWKLNSNSDSDKLIRDYVLDLEQWRIPSAPQIEGVKIGSCLPAQYSPVIAFVSQYFPFALYPGWINKYLSLKGTNHIPDVILATSSFIDDSNDGNNVLAVAIVYTPASPTEISRDIPWPRLIGDRVGGIACFCIRPDYVAKEKLAPMLLLSCLLELKQRGMTKCFVDWATGEQRWYRDMGFQGWARYLEVWRQI